MSSIASTAGATPKSKQSAPKAWAGRVLIATQAASLNFADLLMMEGKYQHKASLPFVPGRDAAGTVLAVGDTVRGFAPGDRVVATPNHGAFAEQTVASAGVCHKIPDGVSFEDAAACGTGIPTIVAAISLRARLEPGEWVMISGAAGGMGSLAVQYAKALGGRVAALVSSAEKAKLVSELGADLVLRSDEITDLKAGLRAALEVKGVDGVDAAIDMVGGDTFEAMIRCIRPEGRLVVVGFASGRIPNVAANYLLLKDIAVIGSSMTRLLSGRHQECLSLCDEAYTMLADGRLHATIEGRYPLDRFVEAASRIADRQVVGKIILQPTAK
ncbi:MAG: NADPH:quinone oxidoreductase family protein [Hyphomicrobiaceae bacterium]